MRLVDFLTSFLSRGLFPGSYAELSILLGLGCGAFLLTALWLGRLSAGTRLAVALLPSFIGGILTAKQAWDFGRAGYVGMMSLEEVFYSWNGAAVFGVVISLGLSTIVLVHFWWKKFSLPLTFSPKTRDCQRQ